nr:immunoglobulin light chain junction region [Macaca mulatta]MOX78741.1 immunoglobulin light chain junction region [Macaca mulatta]MOX78768.1 immunoglobulin light chain junction region [Macaca mulatta]MOX79354.1 immunoglobulin light chain junction region [Macaca mulatta]MOX79391.1 immunoglobulin light chain junction region [Macaca mulatta]
DYYCSAWDSSLTTVLF